MSWGHLGTKEKDDAFQQDRTGLGRWVTLTHFVGSTERGRRRQFATHVLVEAGCDETEAAELAPELLGAVFKQLHQHALENVNDRREPTPGEFPWLERTLRHVAGRAPEDGLRLIFPELALRKPGQLYVCTKTGHLWPRSVLGCAPERGSRGTLEPIDPKDIDPASFVGRARREYLADSQLFKIGLWAEEHSAQLAPQEARRLQELFRRGIRNLLSATTTLELGIDIGGLSGAFLSNVPPGKANYLQRAGRVGRRADGSSVVVTCARSRPYDREVFRRIGDFLARSLRQPRVFLERERIARRHFHAWLMGSFFEQLYHPDRHSVGAMSAFGHMGSFCGQPLPPWWESGVAERPRLTKNKDKQDYERPEWWDPEAGDVLAEQYLRWVTFAEQQPFDERLDGLFRGTAFERPNAREGLFQDALELFERALATWRSDYTALLKSWKTTKAMRQANAIRYQLKTLHNVTVIEALSNAQYLPRYGFPIGLHKLRVIAEDQARRGKIREEDQYRLERSSLLALREYVPGSQLLVGGKLITSRGLLKHWTGANVNESFGLRGGSTRCENQHFYYWYSDKPQSCPICDGRPSGTIDQLLFPKHGFTTAAWDPPKRSTDSDRVGTVQTETIAFARRASKEAALELKEDSFAGIQGIPAIYKEEAEILVKNAGDDELGFAVCVGCGYAESERRKQKGKLPPRFENHAPLHEPNTFKSCRQTHGDSTALRNQVLCAAEPTDILMLDLSGPLASRADAEILARSLAAALHLAGARLLQLDSRELGHMAVPVGSSQRAWGAVVFDNVPGGAGHVLELMKNGRAWLEATRDLLHGSPEHHELCQRACLDCLMTFDVQSNFSDSGPQLDRRSALAFLEMLLGEEPPGPPALEGLPGVAADEKTGLPVLDFSRLSRGEKAPVAWRKLNGEPEPNLFLARMDTESVSRQVEPGTWCLFRRDVATRDLAQEGQLVVLCDPQRTDPEHGPLVVRRLKYAPVGRKVVVKLLPETRDQRYQRWTLELTPEEWEHWTPFAVLVQPLQEEE